MIKRLSVCVIVFLVLGFLSACGKHVSPNTYQASEAGVASKVVPGVVIGKRAVKVDASTGIGGVAGAVAGGAGGSAIGGSTQANIAGAVGGAVVGGAIAHVADKAINTHQAFEYIIRLKTGATIAITQVQELQFELNQPVLIIYGAMTRIIPDNTHGH